MKKIKVYYDGNCKVCDKEINYYRRHDTKKKFTWINIHKSKKEIDNLKIGKEDLMNSLHIKTEHGEIIKGVDAFIRIWRNFKYFKYLAVLVQIAPIKKVANFFYKMWAKNRNKKLIFNNETLNSNTTF